MPRRMVPLLLAALACLSLGTSPPVEPPGEQTPAEVGLAVGERAPAFTLVDQDGASRSLTTLLGRGQLAIIFYRSADW